MDLRLQGRTAIVLGAGGGLGGAVADALAAEGVRVACVSRQAERADATAQRLRDAGQDATAFVWDMSAPDAAHELVAKVHAAFGSVDILFLNSPGPPPGDSQSFTASQWRGQFDAMFISVVGLTEAALDHMRRAGWGRVIVSTSSGTVTPIPDLAASNSLRSALTAWAKTLAAEVAREGITVNTVVPGRIATLRVEAIDRARAAREGRSFHDITERSTNEIPVGRYGTPEEFAAAVAFLAGAPATYITGSTLRVDGGLIRSL